MTAATIMHDPVEAPRHYFSKNGIEVIDIIEVYGLGDSFHLGSAMKYLLRAGEKVGPDQTPQEAMIQDLAKAAWYCKRYRDREDAADLAWPGAMEDAENLLPIENVVGEFGLTGSRAEAVTDLLNLCVGDDIEPIEQCIENIERAIKEVA